MSVSFMDEYNTFRDVQLLQTPLCTTTLVCIINIVSILFINLIFSFLQKKSQVLFHFH